MTIYYNFYLYPLKINKKGPEAVSDFSEKGGEGSGGGIFCLLKGEWLYLSQL